jgi:hypothetical protein
MIPATIEWNGFDSPAMSQPSELNSPSISADQLRLWQTAATALGRSDRYRSRLQQAEADVAAGLPISQKAQQSMQADLQAFEQTLENLRHWYRTSQHLGKGEAYLRSIQKVAEAYKSGVPLSENAIGAMHENVSLWNVVETARLILEKLGRDNGAEGKKFYQGKQYGVRGTNNDFCLMNLQDEILLELQDGRILINKLTPDDFQHFWETYRKLSG